jgi:hypothetical protein
MNPRRDNYGALVVARSSEIQAAVFGNLEARKKLRPVQYFFPVWVVK